MKLFLCVLLIGAAVAMPNLEWEKFKQKFGKYLSCFDNLEFGKLLDFNLYHQPDHYKAYTPEEEVYRRSVFEDNQKFIQKHNAEYAKGLHTYTVGTNKFADLTNAEFVSIYNGYRRVNTTRRSTYVKSGNFKNQVQVDWRAKGAVTPVKNQGQCGSCWAFSTTGSLEGQHFLKTDKLVALSEQNLVDCSGKSGNEGCEGGLMDQAFEYIKANGGIDTEASYPYEAVDDTCRFNPNTIGATFTGYTDIPTGSESALQEAVTKIGPISAGIDASSYKFQLYKDGVYDDHSCSSTLLDHAVLVVGYGEELDKLYWLVKNSWGTTWGMEGYIMMSRDKNNQCGIATAASYPLV
ncbi:procathepsin L-like [Antedon mediterranea]|uniref:procathepsin L-like n=1 Tax=Antedon mediterranea TaxID=105859 RepID=UPI003AF9F779